MGHPVGRNWGILQRVTAFAVAALLVLFADAIVCTDTGHHVARDPRAEVVKLQIPMLSPDDKDSGAGSAVPVELPFQQYAAISASDTLISAAFVRSRIGLSSADLPNAALAHRRSVVLLI